MRVWVLPTATIMPLRSALEAQLQKRGIEAEVEVAAFGEMEQQALDARSRYRNLVPAVTVIAADAHDLFARQFDSPWTCDRRQREEAIAHAVGRVASVATAAADISARVIVCNGVHPPVNALGLLEANPRLSLGSLVGEYNRRMGEAVAPLGNVTVFDYAGLVAHVGYSRFHDDRMWINARMRLSGEGLAQLARMLARLIAAQSRRPRKCIVVDLDNTLWGGVLGEDGAAGLRVGEDGIGHAFARFQRELLAVRARGVLLAIASKNEEGDAMKVLRSHPGMVLRPEHFAAFRIHWRPKVDSLREIAAELGFGLDALVFVDDSPHEIEAVVEQLPDVATVRLPEDPAYYVEALRGCEELDTLQVTEEDRARSGMVATERTRSDLRARMPDLASFLRSLEQVATLEPLAEENLARAAQLCSRTNQFNLTLRRHDVETLRRFLAGPHAAVLLRARDRLGDSGIVGFALALPCGDAVWQLDTVVMSCRVVGRGLETVLLAEVIRAVRQCGGDELRASYVPGPRNAICAGTLPEQGFDPQDAENAYSFPVASRQFLTPDFIHIERWNP